VQRRTLAASLLTGLLAAASLLAPAATALAAPTSPVVTFGIQPAGLGAVDQRGYFSYSATPGAHITDHAALLNYSYKPLTLRVAVTDALDTPTGGFALLPDGQAPKDVGTWMTFPGAPDTVTVPARVGTRIGEYDLPLSIRIPADANPGDHVGGITVSLDSLAQSPTGQKYKLVQRVGARLFVRVIGKLRPELSISNLAVAYRTNWSPFGSGSAVVTYTVRNTGNVALGGSQDVAVHGLFGASTSATRPARIPLLLPGFGVQMRVVVHGIVPEFRETATVTVSGLVVAGSVQPAAGPWTASAGFWAVPIWFALLLLVLLLLAGVELYLRRGRLRGRPDPDPVPAGLDDPPGSPVRERKPAGARS
jgi:hypothetical protein